MGTINYPRHFSILGGAAVLLSAILLIDDLHPIFPDRFICYFGLIGALHAASLVSALRGSASVSARVWFIAGAAVLSVGVPFVGLIAAKGLASDGNSFAALFMAYGVASATGASTYWLLARLLVLPHLPFRTLCAAVLFCTSATLSVVALQEYLSRGPNVLLPTLATLAWWAAFSASLLATEAKHGG